MIMQAWNTIANSTGTQLTLAVYNVLVCKTYNSNGYYANSHLEYSLQGYHPDRTCLIKTLAMHGPH